MENDNKYVRIPNNKVIDKKIPFSSLDKIVKITDINDIVPPKDEMVSKEIDDSFIKCVSEKKHAKELLQFSKTIVCNFNNKDLATFYNNMSSLVVSEFDSVKYNKKNKSAQTLAYYKPAINTVFVSGDTSTLYHELFHMSTTKRIGDYLYSGLSFSDLRKNISIGNGINEGYTQLLSERYFDDSIKGNYQYFVYILLLIEELIGKEKMESLYMKSNLYGLLDELKNYASYEEICRFVTYMDYLVKNMHNKKINNKGYAIIGSMCTYINEFIVTAFINKIKMNKPNTEEEYIEMANYVSNLFNRVIIVIRIGNTDVKCTFVDDYDFMYNLAEDLNDLDIDFIPHVKKKVL